MDSGKLAQLRKVQWSPAKCCLTCTFGKFGKGDWGLCGLAANTYTHNKHKRKHDLPAHRFAVCRNYSSSKVGPVPELRAFLDSEVTS